jgi:hypothetical protein
MRPTTTAASLVIGGAWTGSGRCFDGNGRQSERGDLSLCRGTRGLTRLADHWPKSGFLWLRGSEIGAYAAGVPLAGRIKPAAVTLPGRLRDPLV